MGTFVTVSFASNIASKTVFSRVFSEMRKTAARLDWHDPNGEIGKLNAYGYLSHASADVLTVMRSALSFSDLSRGAFDISVLPLIRLWERGEAVNTSHVFTYEIAAALEAVNYKNIIIEDDSVRFLRPNMRISLAGIAKGFVVDKGMSVLRNAGVADAMINGGGDIRVMRSESEPPWRIGVQDPLKRKGLICVAEARNLAIASSGSYARAYNDIIDPRTGKHTRSVAGVSVIARETMSADAFATCLHVLGPEAGIALAERREKRHIAALIVSKDGTRRATANWSLYCADADAALTESEYGGGAVC
jgi:thiamine biosynthesis lipoprotein